MYAFSIFDPLNYFERSSIKRAFSSHVIILVRNLQGRNQSLLYPPVSSVLRIHIYIYIYIYVCYIYIYIYIYVYIYIYIYVYIFEQKPSKAILLDHLEICFILSIFRSGPPEVFLGKSVLKICSKFTGEHPYRSVISVKLPSNFIKITLWHG